MMPLLQIIVVVTYYSLRGAQNRQYAESGGTLSLGSQSGFHKNTEYRMALQNRCIQMALTAIFLRYLEALLCCQFACINIVHIDTD